MKKVVKKSKGEKANHLAEIKAEYLSKGFQQGINLGKIMGHDESFQEGYELAKSIYKIRSKVHGIFIGGIAVLIVALIINLL